jgi:hypothetical protein
MLFGGIEESMVHNAKENTYERKIGPNADIYVMKLSQSKYRIPHLPALVKVSQFSNLNFFKLQNFICRHNSNLFGTNIQIQINLIWQKPHFFEGPYRSKLPLRPRLNFTVGTDLARFGAFEACFEPRSRADEGQHVSRA